MTQQDPLFLIDGIGPFFKDYKKVRVNWSKIPWRRIQKLNPEQRQTYFDTVYGDLETFCESTKEIGYNAVLWTIYLTLRTTLSMNPKSGVKLLKTGPTSADVSKLSKTLE